MCTHFQTAEFEIRRNPHPKYDNLYPIFDYKLPHYLAYKENHREANHYKWRGQDQDR